MTLSSTTTKKQYAGDGATTEFPTTFKFLKNADVKAIHRDASGNDTTWVEGTDYTLAGAGDDNGGPLTATTAPAAGETLTIKRAAAATQGAALPLGGSFPSTSVEQAFDLLTMLVQQRSEELDRTLTGAEADPEVNLVLPSTTSRALRYLAFDASGGVITTTATSSTLTPVSAFIEENLLDDVDPATARATLDAAKTDLLKSGTSQAEITGTQLEVLIAGVQRLLLTASLLKAFTGLEIVSTDATNVFGPTSTLYRDSGSPAANDRLGSRRWDANNSAAVQTTIADIVGQLDDPTDSSEDASLLVRLMRAGVFTDIFWFGAGAWLAGTTGGDPGASRLNAKGYEVDGTDLPFQIMEESPELDLVTKQLHSFTPSNIATITGAQLWLRCKTAQSSFAVGDEVLADTNQDQDTGGVGGTSKHTLMISGGAAKLQLSGAFSNAWRFANPDNTGGGIVSLANSSWRGVIRVFGF